MSARQRQKKKKKDLKKKKKKVFWWKFYCASEKSLYGRNADKKRKKREKCGRHHLVIFQTRHRKGHQRTETGDSYSSFLLSVRNAEKERELKKRES